MDVKNPLISIITITFNSEKYLEQTILSVINQTYKNVEYIIIDGGSTDATLEIIKKYENNITKWISEKDKGISDAMNKGILMCSGEYIGIIHSDDWYEPTIVQKIVNNSHKGDVIHGNIQYWNDNIKYYTFAANHNLLRREMSINHASVFVKRSIYQKFGFFNVNYRYAMDYDLLLRFYLNKLSFFYINETLANMRLGGTSDEYWENAYYESYIIKIANNQNKIWSYLYYLYIKTRKLTVIFLEKYNLTPIVSFIRKYFSTVSKSNEESIINQ